jgi:hypothetical protein
VVGDAIQQCAGEPLGAEDFGPFVEGQVGHARAGDCRCGLFKLAVAALPPTTPPKPRRNSCRSSAVEGSGTV